MPVEHVLKLFTEVKWEYLNFNIPHKRLVQESAQGLTGS